MADICMYFEYRNSQKVQLPVNPEKLEIREPGRNSTAEVIALGEISILKLSGLSTISFESFIPTQSNASYIAKDAVVYDSKFYRDFFNAVKKEREPLNFIVSGLGINIEISVEDFDYWWEGSDPDMYFKISLKEFKDAKVKTVTISPAAKANIQQERKNAAKKVAVGSKVRVNGRLHKDSYGAGPGATEKDAIRKVNFIKPGRKCPYHVTTLSGGWRGWVTEQSVEVIE